MWVARDKDGDLRFFPKSKPVRTNLYWTTEDGSFTSLLDPNLFPDLKWEDEPMEVMIFPMPSNAFISTESFLESTPPHCRVCSHCHCMQPKGQEVCEYYNERVEYFNKLK